MKFMNTSKTEAIYTLSPYEEQDREHVRKTYCKFAGCSLDEALDENNIDEWALNRTSCYTNRNLKLVKKYLFDKDTI